ncbi:MAG: hypothetical protein JO240_01885, partial [Solirubrobacterales bacterium]|nr:hypothetical protein [Solirubrobacterales bacterium]
MPAPTRANAATSALVVPAPTRAGAATSALVVPAPTRANAATSSPWTRPFQIAGPFSRDVIPARIAFSSSGEATIAFGVFDEDFPSVSEARIVVRSPAGQLARGRRVPGADQVLDLAYDGPTLELLTGTSRTGHTCCATVRAVPFTHGGFGAGRTLATGLGGVTLGSLLALAGQRLLAAIG